MQDSKTILSLEDFEKASQNISDVIVRTNLEYNDRLSKKFRARIYFKREDLQITRSYKIRGAYNFICNLSAEQRSKGILTASAGNHSQGVAFSANKLKIMATIFMPETTQEQKIRRVEYLGGKFVSIKLVGKNFDESLNVALRTSKDNGAVFVPPFDDELVIAGQGTVGKEINDALNGSIDIIICPIGGGGLIAGVASYFNQIESDAEILGVEPIGAEAMYQSLKQNKLVTLPFVDTFVDGAAVKTVGVKTFKIVRSIVENILLVPVGKICSTMIELYQDDGIITEPAGALSVSALDQIKDSIKDKTVVCVISGGNNDLMRYGEIIKLAEDFKKDI